MHLGKVAIVTGLAACGLVLSGMSSGAAPKQSSRQSVAVGAPAATAVSSQSRARRTSRARTRITVQPRSYLDGGTEVLPGDRKYTDYAIPPTSFTSATSVLDNTPFSRPTMFGPFDLPGRNNPFQW